MNSSSNNFNPPSADQLLKHLTRHPARPPSKFITWLPLIVLCFLLALTMFGNSAAAALVPWLLVGGLMVAMSMRSRRLRELEKKTNQAQDLALLRHHPQALRLAWRLLPKLEQLPHLHARILAVFAHSLDQLQASEAAIIAYDELIERIPPKHPGSLQLRVHRAIAQFMADHLIDGDDSIRKLRGLVMESNHPPTIGAYTLAELLQRIRTNHFEDALQLEPILVERLRGLGVEAGYGYGLMALARLKMATAAQASNDPNFAAKFPQHMEAATQWWSDARLLLTAEALGGRYPELRILVGTLVVNPLQLSAQIPAQQVQA